MVELIYKSDLGTTKLDRDELKRHIVYTFKISGVSRAYLQEHARHQHLIGLSVQSSRFTLKKLLKKDIALEDTLYKTGNPMVDQANIETMKRLVDVMTAGPISNDELKYLLPEAFLTEFYWTAPLSTIENFISLRRAKDALPEAQKVAEEVLNAIY